MDPTTQVSDKPIVIPASFVPHVKGLLGGSFRESIASHLLTMIVGGAITCIGAWYTFQYKLQESERRIEQLELTTVNKEQFKFLMDTVIEQNKTTNARLSNIETALMHPARQ